MTIQTRGELKTAPSSTELVLRADRANLVRLRDVGRAEEGAGGLSHHRARPAATLCLSRVVKQAKGNTVKVAHAVKRRLMPSARRCHRVRHVGGLRLQCLRREAISEVCRPWPWPSGWSCSSSSVFLRNLRSTLIPAVAIPVSIVGLRRALRLRLLGQTF